MSPGRMTKNAGIRGGAGVFGWRAGGKEKGSALGEAVSDYLRISKEVAVDLIDFGAVHVQGKMVRDPSAILSQGQEIIVSFPSNGPSRFYQIEPARVIFRDPFLLAYDKEAGIPSQQLPFDAYNNVFAALSRYLLAQKKGGRYVALHHRLDTETSGVLLFALDPKANEPIARAFRESRVKKEYLAWVEGRPENDRWSCEAPIGKAGGKYKALVGGEGKPARTVFTVLSRQQDRSLVMAAPATGRTHQIRIHLALAGHPVAGDRAYGAKPDNRLYLHAWRLRLKHPVSGKVLSFEVPVPGGWPHVPEIDWSGDAGGSV
ncbi:MAG: RluA family pseudouridine synthase [Syntrophobacteraceae bacterium]|nr:RluA family pseudouridine synthase [Syntrophobacteraceae bacterium]